MYYFKLPTSFKEAMQRTLPLGIVATSLYYNRDFDNGDLNFRYTLSIAALTSFSFFSRSEYSKNMISKIGTFDTAHRDQEEEEEVEAKINQEEDEVVEVKINKGLSAFLGGFHSSIIESILIAIKPTFGLSLPIPSIVYKTVSRGPGDIIGAFCLPPEDKSQYKEYTYFAANMVSKSLFWYFLENGKGNMYSIGMACAAKTFLTFASAIPYYLKNGESVLSSLRESNTDAVKSCIIECAQDSLRLVLIQYFTPRKADIISPWLEMLLMPVAKQIEQYF